MSGTKFCPGAGRGVCAYHQPGLCAGAGDGFERYRGCVADADGMVLYTFRNDEAGVSNMTSAPRTGRRSLPRTALPKRAPIRSSRAPMARCNGPRTACRSITGSATPNPARRPGTGLAATGTSRGPEGPDRGGGGTLPTCFDSIKTEKTLGSGLPFETNPSNPPHAPDNRPSRLASRARPSGVERDFRSRRGRISRNGSCYRNQRWAERMGLGGLADVQWLDHFGRFAPLPGSFETPLALRYHGHQFQAQSPAWRRARVPVCARVRP